MVDNNIEQLKLLYNIIETLQEKVKTYGEALDSSASATKALTTKMEEQLKVRKDRRRLTILLGAAALILGVLALLDSSFIGVGFHQTWLVAVGGALVTFFLVDLILDRMLEIPNQKAKEIGKDVEKLKSLNAKMTELAQVLVDEAQKDRELEPAFLEIKRRIASAGS